MSDRAFYSVTVEVERKVDPATVGTDDFDDVMDRLAPYHPAVSVSARGWLEVAISVTARSLAQATSMALALVDAATGAAPLTIEAMIESEQHARLFSS